MYTNKKSKGVVGIDLIISRGTFVSSNVNLVDRPCVTSDSVAFTKIEGVGSAQPNQGPARFSIKNAYETTTFFIELPKILDKLKSNTIITESEIRCIRLRYTDQISER